MVKKISIIEDWIELREEVDNMTNQLNKDIINIKEFEKKNNQIIKDINNLHWKTKRFLEDREGGV